MSFSTQATTFRLAGDADGDAIGRLHAASWRAHYRGSLADTYLDGPVEDERRAAWTAALTSPSPGQTVVLADHAGTLAGFVCALCDLDPAWGTLIDNLHVATACKARGLGRALMANVAGRLSGAAADRPVHLYVIDANADARAFYQRIGGLAAGQDRHPMPDGSVVPVIRIVWPSPADLARQAMA